MLSTNTAVLAADLGKTGCRVRLTGPDGERREGEGPGAVGLAGVDGIGQVCRAVELAARAAGLGAGAVGEVSAGAAGVGAVAVGLAGYEAAAPLRIELGERLARACGAPVVLASDVTTSHAGAFGGAPGVVVAAGTGAVALALDASGRSSHGDGWGFLLGDDGGGYAVGRDGLRAALAHAEGDPDGEALARRAEQRFGDLASLPSVVHGSEHPSRLVAGFARDVADLARAGDSASMAIWDRAGRALARTALATRDRLDPDLPVCLAGGLASVGELLSVPFERELRAAKREGREAPVVAAPAGTSLDGAAMLGARLAEGGADAIPAALRQRVTVVPGVGRASSGAAVSGEAGAAARGEALPGDTGASGATDLGALATESARTDLADLDERPTAAILTELWSAEAEVPRVLLEAAPRVADAVDAVAARLREGGRMFYVGAGTPARLALVDASELPPTYGTDPGLVRALTAGGEAMMARAKEGAEDDAAAGRGAVAEAGVGAGDVVVGLTASGRTPFVIDALRAAGERGALTVSVAANPGAEVSAVAEHPIELVTGPEVISGSTRLKAGTAQKLFLNGLSTAVMIRLGKTYGPYMVDMQATNHKLRLRAVRMVRRVTGADEGSARAALEAADWSTKIALVMVLRDLDAAAARALLGAGDGSVRAALASHLPGTSAP